MDDATDNRPQDPTPLSPEEFRDALLSTVERPE